MKTIASAYSIENGEDREMWIIPTKHVVQSARGVSLLSPGVVTWCDENLKSFTIYRSGGHHELWASPEDMMLAKLKLK